jgi:hypothetical protein
MCPFKRALFISVGGFRKNPPVFFTCFYPDRKFEWFVLDNCGELLVCRKTFSGNNVLLAVAIIFILFIRAGNIRRGLLWMAN